VVFDQCHEINWQQTSKSIVKFCQAKFDHEWYSEDYFMNKNVSVHSF
jgi:hypothetical protein